MGFSSTRRDWVLDQIGAIFGLPSVNWLGQPETALWAIIIVTIWKEAGFFMIFYFSALQTIPEELRVYVPLAWPTYLAYALLSVSTHWNNVPWPLVVTNSADTRPLTMKLSIFAAPESGVDISVISAATMMTIAPLLIAFLVFQRQFVQAFIRAGIK